MSSAPAPAATAAPPVQIPLPATAFLRTQLAALEPSFPQQLSPLLAFFKAAVDRIEAIEVRTGAIPALVQIRQSTSIPPIAFAAAAFVAIIVAARRIVKANAPLVSNLVGAVYPGVRSILAIERPQQDDDERWLTYWTIFGVFSLTDQASAKILKYFPLYFTTKMAVLYWLMKMDGSLVVYRKVARPLLVKYAGLASPAASGHSGEPALPYVVGK
ncbi:TB2/DP1, HVA22 family-domain-containing protein [Zopfochytrium polystomum]|nr:TB2/DP1, HVA22 family-domain-containing protein [Zopfochytrium polystomum]